MTFAARTLQGAADDVAAQTYLTGQYLSVAETGTPHGCGRWYQLGSDGVAYTIRMENGITDPAVGISGQWLVSGNASDYECYATLDSGTLTTGTTGSWMSLSSLRSWSVQRTSVGVSLAQITIQIRHIPSNEVVETAVIEFDVGSEP